MTTDRQDDAIGTEAALKQHLLEAGEAFDQACAELNSERAVTDALVDRLKLSEARRIALQVAHGDLAPDTYESRRRASDATVDQIVSIVRKTS